MICYLDMTFCGFKDCVKFKSCSRALTDIVIQRAESIKLPIARYCDKPECYKKESEGK